MTGTNIANTAYAMPGLRPNGQQMDRTKQCSFQMPLHYPRYSKKDYENMPEWKIDCLLNQYGLPVIGDIHQKRKFAIGAFTWPSQDE